MKTSFLGQRLAWRVAGWLSFLTALAVGHAAQPTLALSGFPKSVHAGAPTTFRLAALNASTDNVSWTFPREIVCRLVSQQGETAAVASLVDSAQSPFASIAPGGFKQVEYTLTLPHRMTGQVTVEFGSLAASPIVVDVQAPPADPVAAQPEPPLWKRLLRDAEPQEAGTALEPGRFFKEHIFGYEPFYFIAGTESPNARFQVSFKYRVLNEDGRLAEKAPVLTGLHLAYTQTSLWDWSAQSRPFYDSSYKPEVLYAWEKVAGGKADDWFRLDLQGGLQHESNGKGGADSRSLNIAYLRPMFVFGRDDSLQLKLIPRVWAYVGDLEDNPDLKDYRGYGDLRAVLGWKRGLQVSALGRLGDDWDHESLQLDVTYPMMRVLKGSLSLYLHAQYFTGYGESLLGYRERSSAFRAGISLYR